MIRRLLVTVGLLLAAAGTGRAQHPADVAWNNGNVAEAETLYAERLERDPTDERALHRLA